MMRDHTLVEELLSVRALGGLDGEDVELLRREMSSHGDCQDCRRLEAEMNEAAAWLASSLDPVSVAAGGADAILSLARAEHDVRPRPGSGSAPTTRAADELTVRRERLAWARGLVAAAAALVIVVAGVAVWNRGPATPVTVASTSQAIVRFQGANPGLELAVAYTPGQPGVFMWGSGLADPGSGKVYEIWTFHGTVPVSAGCITPTGGTIATRLPTDTTGVKLMAVTVESSSCPSAPTTTPILTANLT